MNTKYNPLTHSYETQDGTTVASEVCDSDALLAATIREQQRLVKEALAQPEQEPVSTWGVATAHQAEVQRINSELQRLKIVFKTTGETE
jgi:hypothetical protein